MAQPCGTLLLMVTLGLGVGVWVRGRMHRKVRFPPRSTPYPNPNPSPRPNPNPTPPTRASNTEASVPALFYFLSQVKDAVYKLLSTAPFLHAVQALEDARDIVDAREVRGWG